LVLSGNGYNPLRWDCEKQGCFNKKRRPKIEIFSDCFPGRINFGDVDGIVEINGRGLFLEWKGNNGNIPKGQQILHEKLTKDGLLTTLCVVGDPEEMKCEKYCLFFKGKQTKFKECDLAKVKHIIKKWVNYAQNNSN